jgi:hypothetical protein
MPSCSPSCPRPAGDGGAAQAVFAGGPVAALAVVRTRRPDGLAGAAPRGLVAEHVAAAVEAVGAALARAVAASQGDGRGAAAEVAAAVGGDAALAARGRAARAGAVGAVEVALARTARAARTPKTAAGARDGDAAAALAHVARAARAARAAGLIHEAAGVGHGAAALSALGAALAGEAVAARFALGAAGRGGAAGAGLARKPGAALGAVAAGRIGYAARDAERPLAGVARAAHIAGAAPLAPRAAVVGPLAHAVDAHAAGAALARALAEPAEVDAAPSAGAPEGRAAVEGIAALGPRAAAAQALLALHLPVARAAAAAGLTRGAAAGRGAEVGLGDVLGRRVGQVGHDALRTAQHEDQAEPHQAAQKHRRGVCHAPAPSRTLQRTRSTSAHGTGPRGGWSRPPASPDRMSIAVEGPPSRLSAASQPVGSPTGEGPARRCARWRRPGPSPGEAGFQVAMRSRVRPWSRRHRALRAALRPSSR